MVVLVALGEDTDLAKAVAVTGEEPTEAVMREAAAAAAAVESMVEQVVALDRAKVEVAAATGVTKDSRAVVATAAVSLVV